MHTTDRQDKILSILQGHGYATVNELAEITFSSPSSIRRDLTRLQNNGLVQRTHGGVSLPETVSGVASFPSRKTENVRLKQLVAKKAADLIRNGQTILLDGSSSVTFLLPYIAKLSGVQIYTNNLSTAVEAIEKGIRTNCLGGSSLCGSMVMTGPDTCRLLEGLNPDICFFSSKSLNSDGTISDPNAEENYIRQIMIRRSKRSVFLCDSSKFKSESLYRLASLDEITISVFDREYPELANHSKIML